MFEDLRERIRINEATMKENLIKKGRKQGIKQKMLNVIKNMLEQNEDEEKIMRYTNAKREDIEKVKRKLSMS